ncbi:MAG: hypothetical protein J6U04_02120 [Salinivirgaceae bacterium]|nr:hypothetical protein [Salinivirgaceae bacterium]
MPVFLCFRFRDDIRNRRPTECADSPEVRNKLIWAKPSPAKLFNNENYGDVIDAVVPRQKPY